MFHKTESHVAQLLLLDQQVIWQGLLLEQFHIVQYGLGDLINVQQPGTRQANLNHHAGFKLSAERAPGTE